MACICCLLRLLGFWEGFHTLTSCLALIDVVSLLGASPPPFYVPLLRLLFKMFDLLLNFLLLPPFSLSFLSIL